MLEFGYDNPHVHLALVINGFKIGQAKHIFNMINFVDEPQLSTMAFD